MAKKYDYSVIVRLLIELAHDHFEQQQRLNHVEAGFVKSHLASMIWLGHHDQIDFPALMNLIGSPASNANQEAMQIVRFVEPNASVRLAEVDMHTLIDLAKHIYEQRRNLNLRYTQQVAVLNSHYSHVLLSQYIDVNGKLTSKFHHAISQSQGAGASLSDPLSQDLSVLAEIVYNGDALVNLLKMLTVEILRFAERHLIDLRLYAPEYSDDLWEITQHDMEMIQTLAPVIDEAKTLLQFFWSVVLLCRKKQLDCGVLIEQYASPYISSTQFAAMLKIADSKDIKLNHPEWTVFTTISPETAVLQQFILYNLYNKDYFPAHTFAQAVSWLAEDNVVVNLVGSGQETLISSPKAQRMAASALLDFLRKVRATKQMVLLNFGRAVLVSDVLALLSPWEDEMKQLLDELRFI